MKNGDLMMLLCLALFGVIIWAIMKRYPASVNIQNTPSPLPSGMYTSGSISNGMDVARRRNFNQQPYGGPTTG